MDREVHLQPIRVASVFADKVKDEFDDGDLSVLEKEKFVSRDSFLCLPVGGLILEYTSVENYCYSKVHMH